MKKKALAGLLSSYAADDCSDQIYKSCDQLQYISLHRATLPGIARCSGLYYKDSARHRVTVRWLYPEKPGGASQGFFASLLFCVLKVRQKLSVRQTNLSVRASLTRMILKRFKETRLKASLARRDTFNSICLTSIYVLPILKTVFLFFCFSVF